LVRFYQNIMWFYINVLTGMALLSNPFLSWNLLIHSAWRCIVWFA
jgi:hypothetical protein